MHHKIPLYAVGTQTVQENKDVFSSVTSEHSTDVNAIHVDSTKTVQNK